jgi:hypothetical protein
MENDPFGFYRHFSDRNKPEKFYVKAKCDIMLKALFEQDAKGFEEAFRNYLNMYHYLFRVGAQMFCHDLLRSALYMAEQNPLSEGCTSDGKYDLHLKSPSGDVYIFELKYLPTRLTPKREFKLKSDGTPAGPVKDKLRLEMARLANQSIAQIDRKYVHKFLYDSKRVFKIALIVSDHSKVLVKLVEEQKKK